MNNPVSKTILSGLGLASLTKDAVSNMCRDLARAADLSEDEGRRVVRHLKQQSHHLEQALERGVESAIHKVSHKLKLNDKPRRTHSAHHDRPRAHSNHRRTGKA